ncbi:hypothetical protein DITRI_Ditri20bG0081100 [Diplodiscus trichospermus]
MEYSSKIVNLCGGLPLALKVLGSSLAGRSMNVWKSALEKLEAIIDSKIQMILRISYDSLQDDHDKNLFLDIACFFIGKDRDYTTTILEGCDFYTTVGIENLIARSLLFVNEKNKLIMHQMLRDMGREIIRQESLDPGKRSRLWHKEALDVIREKNGSETTKCLAVDIQGLLEHKTSLPLAKRSKLVKSNEVYIEIEAFAKMRGLKLLQLDYIKPIGDFKDFPKGLIWLRWRGFSGQSLPMKFDIKRLVVLDMRNNNLKHEDMENSYPIPMCEDLTNTGNNELELNEDLFNLGTCGNVKVQIDNHLEESKTVASPQVLYDCSIITEFHPSKDFLFSQYEIYFPRPKISFTVPSNSSRKISWLKSFVILYAKNDERLDFFPQVEIVNETKGTKWSHDKHLVGIAQTENTMITWLCSWKFREEIEAGDHLNLSVLSDLCLVDGGIDLIYDYEPVDKDNFIDHYLPDVTKCPSQFVSSVVGLLFKSHRTLYRMSLVKD